MSGGRGGGGLSGPFWPFGAPYGLFWGLSILLVPFRALVGPPPNRLCARLSFGLMLGLFGPGFGACRLGASQAFVSRLVSCVDNFVSS